MSDAPPSTWPEYDYQLTVGQYGGLDDRVKRRTKKNPIGFAPPRKRKATQKRSRPR